MMIAHAEESHELLEHATLLDDLERQEPQQESEKPSTIHHSTAYLDGLRGLAALFVFIQHYIGSFDLNVHEHGFGENGNFYFASLPFVRIIFSGGSAAVAIFFVLSGYVLSKSPLRLLRTENRDVVPMRLVSAVIRRPIRLYLPPLAITFLFAILMHAPYDLVPKMPWPPKQPTVLAEIGNWVVESIKFFNPFRTHGSDQGWFPYSLVVWTIPIELKGSMLVFGLIAMEAFTGAPRFLSLALLAITAAIMLQFAFWTMACFMAGLALASIDTDALDRTFLAYHLTQRAQTVVWHALFFTGYYFLCQPSHDGHPEYSLDTPGWHYLSLAVPKAYDQNQYYRFWHSWGAVLLVYSTLRISWMQKFLSTRPLKYLGKVSFMLYLVHLPVLAIFGDRMGRMLGNVNARTEESWFNDKLHIPDVGLVGLSSRWLVYLMVTLPTCLGVADIGTRLLDMPSVKAGKMIVQKLGVEKYR